MIFTLPLLAVLSVVGGGHAQRPNNASVCDYYAMARYGTNTTLTQFQLIQDIVALAYAGAMNLTNVSSDLTGILNPGTFNNQPINLRRWFDGSMPTSNFNNAPAKVAWLDGGDVDPLYRYLSGETSSIEINSTTNQYLLFSHLFIDYGTFFGCSSSFSNLTGDTAFMTVAYVHKFMDLTYNDIAHYLDMFTLSALHFGFSQQDAQRFNNSFNSQYNVRCAPPVYNQNGAIQLYSICQDSTCPLAANPNCSIYVNMTADGGTASSNTGPAGMPSGTPGVLPSYTPTALSTVTTIGPTTSPAAAGTASSSPPLSGGAIGGIVVGGVGALAFLILAVGFFRRRKNKTPPPSAPPSYTTPQMAGPPSGGLASPEAKFYTPMEMDMKGKPSPLSELHPSEYSDSGIRSPSMGTSIPSPQFSLDQRQGPMLSPGFSPGLSPPHWNEGQQQHQHQHQQPIVRANPNVPAELEAKETQEKE